MNIFYVDDDPITAAHCLNDTHVRKMIIESAQMLANCYTGLQLSQAPKTQKGTVRKYSYTDHPCSKWVMANYTHFTWLLKHSIELAAEYAWRFEKLHFTSSFLVWCCHNTPRIPKEPVFYEPPFIKGKFGKLVPILPNRGMDIVEAYREYYNTKIYDRAGRRIDVWTRRPKPEWWIEHEDIEVVH